MKNLLMLLAFLSLVSFSCKDDDAAVTDYTVDISINNPIANSTHNVLEMIPLEVVFSRGAEEVIHHIKIELFDSAGNSIITLLEEHIHEAGTYTYSLDMAFSVNDPGTYTLRASSHDMEDNHADPVEINFDVQ